MGNDFTDMELARRLRHIGFTGEQICATIDEMKQMRPWDDAQAPKQIQALLRDLLGTTWISMEHVSKVLLYTSGTAAGTSIADIIFVVAFKSVLFEVRKQLSNQNLIYKTEASTKQWNNDTTVREVVFQDVSYSDDVAYPIISDKATHLIPMIKKQWKSWTTSTPKWAWRSIMARANQKYLRLFAARTLQMKGNKWKTTIHPHSDLPTRYPTRTEFRQRT
jgi:hypothetical protein